MFKEDMLMFGLIIVLLTVFLLFVDKIDARDKKTQIECLNMGHPVLECKQL